MSDDLVKRLRGGLAIGEEAADRIEELEKALANIQREYDKRGDRIKELEAKLKTMIDQQVAESMVRVAEPMLSDALAAADKRIEELELSLIHI